MFNLYLTVAQLAELTGMSRQAIYKAIEKMEMTSRGAVTTLVSLHKFCLYKYGEDLADAEYDRLAELWEQLEVEE